MNSVNPRRRYLATVTLTWLLLVAATPARAEITDTIVLRGHRLTLHVYGVRGSPPVVLSSGDGGWMHLGPHVAEVLAARGYFVVGFDAKAYLESFTSGTATLRTRGRARRLPGAGRRMRRKDRPAKPMLVGVSEGAGLSRARRDGSARPSRSSPASSASGCPTSTSSDGDGRTRSIYVTHGVPKEPTFSAAAIVGRVAPAAAGGDSFDERRVRAALPRSQRLDRAAPTSPSGCGSCRVGSPFQRQPRRIRPAAARGDRLGRAASAPMRTQVRGRVRKALPALIGLALFVRGARGAAPRAARCVVARR